MNQRFDLIGRTVIITGGGKGIGKVYVEEFAKAGAHVVAIARTTGALEELDDQIRAAEGSATLVPLDVTDTGGIARLAEALDKRYNRLDILIGNAAIVGNTSPLGHVEPKSWDQVMAINVTANWHLIRFLDPLLQKSDAGRAVFITSGAASNARAYRGPYSVSKAALDVLARTYAAETATTKVRVNLFNPGPTRTRMRASVMPGEDPATLPKPAQVAESILPLCLPDMTETGKLYDFPSRSLKSFREPA